MAIPNSGKGAACDPIAMRLFDILLCLARSVVFYQDCTGFFYQTHSPRD